MVRTDGVRSNKGAKKMIRKLTPPSSLSDMRNFVFVRCCSCCSSDNAIICFDGNARYCCCIEVDETCCDDDDEEEAAVLVRRVWNAVTSF